MITLYDMPCTLPSRTWSLNPWKARYVLNYKNIPHQTVWVEYHDIQSTLKDAGFTPARKLSDGSDFYSVPAIIDSSTGAKVMDSIKIAAYLDKTYPDTPAVLPHASAALQHAFSHQFYPAMEPVVRTLLPKVPKILNEGAGQIYHDRRSEYFGKPLEQVDLVGEERVEAFKKLKTAFDTFDGCYQENGGGPFMMGETISFADFIIVSAIQMFKLWGEESEDWKNFVTWNNGRWMDLFKRLEQYADFRG